MYSLDELANYISLKKIPIAWDNCFNEINKSYNSGWLKKHDFDSILDYYDFDVNFWKRFKDELKSLYMDNKLNFICYIMYYILFIADNKNYYNIWLWESTSNTFENNGSYMIPVVALLCGYEFHVKNMKYRNFDSEQIMIQKNNIKLVCTNDKIKYGIDGIRFSQMMWGSYFMKGNLIQIGRLQYEISAKKFDDLDKYFQDQRHFIYIHIPSGNKLDEEDVKESLWLADKAIKKYYSELKNEKLAYYTKTWLLSPEVKEILPNDSNIIKFQDKFNIIEYEDNISDFLHFVFDVGIDKIDYKNLPEKTALQKGLKWKLLNNDILHLGIGIIKDFRSD